MKKHFFTLQEYLFRIFWWKFIFIINEQSAEMAAQKVEKFLIFIFVFCVHPHWNSVTRPAIALAVAKCHPQDNAPQWCCLYSTMQWRRYSSYSSLRLQGEESTPRGSSRTKRGERQASGSEPGENLSVFVLNLILTDKVLRRVINW